MLDWKEDDNPQLASSTTHLYGMAFKGLVDKSPVSADLFRLFSFFDPERIPLALLTEGSRGIPKSTELGKITKSSFKLGEALANMQSGSLAHRLGYGEEKTSWIHDLVQYLCRQWMKPNERREWAERAINVVAFAYPDTLGSLETWAKAKVYLKHGLACTEHAEVLEIQSLNLGDLMVRMSWFLRQTGNLAAATRLAVRAADCAKVLGEGQRQHMNSMSNLGLMYYHMSRFKEAEKQWISSLQLGKKLLGSGYVDTGIGNNLALLYYQEGRFEEAEKHHLEIYMRRKDVLRDHHPETLGAMGSLANTYHFQGRWEEAVDLKKRIVEERGKYMGENHPETLGGKGSLATTYSDQGLLKEAEELQREVMVGRKDQWGVENPEYLSAKAALSYTFYLQGRLEEAKNYQIEIRDAREALWGEQHVETLGAMRHLAKTCHRQGNLGEAAELQEKAVFGMEKLLGENHAETLGIREELSNTYRDQGLLEGAEELRKQVTKKREELWGRDHAKILQSMEAFSRKDQGFAH
jgi:tetratricopeptide (TPR) repeat protein